MRKGTKSWCVILTQTQNPKPWTLHLPPKTQYLNLKIIELRRWAWPVLGMRFEKPSSMTFVCQVFSTIQGKTKAKHCFFILPWGSTIAVITSTRPAHVAESGPLALLQVLQNSGSLMFMLRVKTLSARDRHWRNSREKIVESTAIQKHACHSTDGLSATENGRGAAEGFGTQWKSNPCRQTIYAWP